MEDRHVQFYIAQDSNFENLIERAAMIAAFVFRYSRCNAIRESENALAFLKFLTRYYDGVTVGVNFNETFALAVKKRSTKFIVAFSVTDTFKYISNFKIGDVETSLFAREMSILIDDWNMEQTSNELLNKFTFLNDVTDERKNTILPIVYGENVLDFILDQLTGLKIHRQPDIPMCHEDDPIMRKIITFFVYGYIVSIIGYFVHSAYKHM